MFFSPPFSYSASLCEQLLAGGSGETPAYSLLFKLNFLWIYVVLTLIQTRMPIGRNAVWIYAVYSYSNCGLEILVSPVFGYMPY